MYAHEPNKHPHRDLSLSHNLPDQQLQQQQHSKQSHEDEDRNMYTICSANYRESSLTPRETSFAGLCIYTLRSESVDPEPVGCPSPGYGKQFDQSQFGTPGYGKPETGLCMQFDQSQSQFGNHNTNNSYTHNGITNRINGGYCCAPGGFLDEETRVNQGELGDVPPIEAILKECEDDAPKEDEDMELLPSQGLVDLAYFYP
jgi:hypothetical protein